VGAQIVAEKLQIRASGHTIMYRAIRI